MEITPTVNAIPMLLIGFIIFAYYLWHNNFVQKWTDPN